MQSHNEDNTINALSYENINKSDYVIYEKYAAIKGKGGTLGKEFIHVSRTDISEKKDDIEGKELAKHKLKFHISLPEEDRSKYAEAWNIIKDILIKHEVSHFKVAHEQIRMSLQPPDGSQRGKDITIYAEYNPEKNHESWRLILQEITEKLVANNIKPGYRSIDTGERADMPILGSNYITYRYEVEDIKVDPIGNISVKVPNQDPPMVYEPESVISYKLNEIKTTFDEIEFRLKNHKYVVNDGGKTIDGIKYTESAALIVNTLKTTKNSDMSLDEIETLAKKIKISLQGKEVYKETFFTRGSRDQTTSSLYKDILSKIATIEKEVESIRAIQLTTHNKTLKP